MARDSFSSFSESDLARLALSRRLRELSEALRLAVAAPDALPGDGSAADSGSTLAEQLLPLLDDTVPALRDTLIGYLRVRGTSWGWIAGHTGLSEDDARARWDRTSLDRVDDPGAAATELDTWSVRMAQLEPLAQIPDPVSRLLSGFSPQPVQCLVCAKYAGKPVPAWAGRPVPPGGHLVDDGTWRVGHGPTGFWPRGTLLIEANRHVLDYAEFTPEEAASLGSLLQRLTTPLKEATGAPRIHVFSCMEGTAHYHMWLVPRIGEVHTGRGFISDPGYCTDAEAVEVVQAVRKAMVPAGAEE